MRLHKNLVLAVIQALDAIYNEGYYADKVVQKALKSDKRWGARDRKFVAETIYDMVRWKRLYNEIAGTKSHYTKENLWKNFAVWAVLKGYQLPDWKQLHGTPSRRIKGLFDEMQSTRALRESIPDWMDQAGWSELGEQWEEELKALNQPAPVVLRTNTLKINRLDLKKRLKEEGIETHMLQKYPDALQLVERKNVFLTKAFKNGWFEVQDASSQLVAPYLDVQPGQWVVDTCAGAGGKTLHLASKMENKGRVIAMDIYEHKLLELKKRAKRAGVHTIETRVIKGSKSIKKLKQKADRVLIDAPCSGLGVIKRNPDSKWKLEPEFLDRIRTTQHDLLDLYSGMVKPGGKLVYATCSILPSENQNQVKRFLTDHKEFQLIKDKKVLPSVSGYDGFYMALLQRS